MLIRVKSSVSKKVVKKKKYIVEVETALFTSGITKMKLIQLNQ